MNSYNINFAYPWLLLAIIPLLIIGLVPYFRLSKKVRRKRNRIVSTILHCFISFFLVLALSGMTFQSKNISLRSDVIILVDKSTSNLKQTTDMDSYIKKIVDETKNDQKYKFGIVTFAHDSIYVSELSTNKERVFNQYKSASKTPVESGTNIEKAINYCINLLPDPMTGHLILLSDGLQTDGSGLQAARDAAALGVRIDTMYFNSASSEPEVQINSIEITGKMTINRDIKIIVEIQSRNKGSASLILYDGETEIERKQIAYFGQVDRYEFKHQFTEAKIAEIHCEIVVGNDILVQNNELIAVASIVENHKILIIDGTGNETEKIHEILEDEYQIDVVRPNGVPTSIQTLNEYSEVIMMNVDVKTLPSNYHNNLINYVYGGGGVFTVGGENTYYNGNMSKSLYEPLLPVELKLEEKNTAIMLVIDKSSSMNTIVPGANKTRLEVAKDAAIACVNAMDPKDYVGVVTFAKESEVKLEVPLTPVSDKVRINDRISDIYGSDGTTYYNALDMASNELRAFTKANNKHIIFMSDGTPTDKEASSFLNLASTLPNVNPTMITLTSIAIGSDHDFDESLLKSMSVLAAGNFYHLTDITKLESILKIETKTTQPTYENIGTYEPVIKSYSPAVSGIQKVPSIEGYTGAVAKPDASTILATKDGDPIYSEWARGNGYVGSLMTDLNGTWSSKYFTETTGITFIRNVVDSLLSVTPRSDLIIEVDDLNYTSALKINSQVPLADDRIEATVKTPKGDTVDIPLDKLGNSILIGHFDTSEVGVYEIKTVRYNSSGAEISTTTIYSTFSYSKEYNNFMSQEEGERLLRAIALSTDGSVLEQTQSEDLFDDDVIEIIKEYDPQFIFIVTSICLFLLELIARKFKFKWPHEWFKKNEEFGR